MLGERIERGIRSHHHRRLSRTGQARAFDPPAGGFAGSGSFAPRRSDVELLVDGAEILSRIRDDVESATTHVHLAGWHFEPSFRLGDGGPTLRELLAETAERVEVRVLAWAGSPLPLFRPDRSDVRAVRDELTRGTRVQVVLDAKERPMHCHHEKLVLVDDRVAYVGGLDLTSLGGDRLDSSEHPLRPGIGWHDACARVEGPVVADVESTSASAGRALSSRRAGRKNGEASTCSSFAPCRSTSTTGCRGVSSRSSRATCARFAPPSVSCISRASSSGHPS